MKRLLKGISLLFLGPDPDPLRREDIGCAYQLSLIRQAWDNPSIGLHRIFRLALEVAAFAFPTLWITQLLRKREANCVDFSSDAWVVGRLILLICLLWSGLRLTCPVTIAVCYLMADILVFLLTVVFLADLHGPPLSNQRSVLFLLVNYFEIILGFAVLHIQWGGLNVELLCPTQALYFSAVTATTLGYGDMFPVTPGAQLRVVSQLFVAFLFVIVLLGAILSRLSTPGGGTCVTPNKGGLHTDRRPASRPGAR